MRTDEWLARTIVASPDPDAVAVFEHIRKAATETLFRELLKGVLKGPDKTPVTPSFQSNPGVMSRLVKKYRGLIVVGTGFLRPKPGEQMRPVIVRISNLFDGSGQRLPLPQDDFLVHQTHFPPSRPTGLVATPALIGTSELANLHAVLKKATKRNVTLGLLATALCKEIRSVAASNSTVSKSLLIGFLTRDSAESEWPMMIQSDYQVGVYVNTAGKRISEFQPPSIVPAFFDVPAERSDGLNYGPLLSCPGSVAISEIEIVMGVGPDGKPAGRARAKLLAKSDNPNWSFGLIGFTNPSPGLITTNDLRR